jgi:hypothetical protein
MRRTILLAILIVPALAACGTAPPRLAAGLQGSNKLGDYPEWDQRVRERFPPGTDEQKLVTELRRQHFVFNPTQAGRASFRSSDLACTQTWGVKWAARDGLITEIAGEHNGACL